MILFNICITDAGNRPLAIESQCRVLTVADALRKAARAIQDHADHTLDVNEEWAKIEIIIERSSR